MGGPQSQGLGRHAIFLDGNGDLEVRGPGTGKAFAQAPRAREEIDHWDGHPVDFVVLSFHSADLVYVRGAAGSYQDDDPPRC